MANIIITTPTELLTDDSNSLTTENNELILANVPTTISVTASTSPSGIGSVQITSEKTSTGFNFILRAREDNDYVFLKWSNGSTENPTTIKNIQHSTNLIAYYIRKSKNTVSNKYRAYIKDSLNLNALPKVFVVVRSFTIRRDLLTTANSQFEVEEKPSDVNDGDIFVLYNPTGTIMYYGIISSIDNTTIQCTQIQSFYSGLWIYDTYSTTSLEAEISYLLDRFANGYQKNSTYQDLLMKQEKEPLVIKTSGETESSLETKEDMETMDFETFIYNVYEKYGIIFDFNIPFNSWEIGSSSGGSVTIRKPNDSIIKIGTNAECIKNVSPTTQTEQTNKLIVYSADGSTYRTTYIATTTNGIVTEPTSNVGRFNVINTSVICSDDDLETIKAANISEDMYNHEIEFTLILDNNLYNFWEWELGQSMQIYDNGNYFDSVFTGYELTKDDNKNITEVTVICGKVRNKLTSLLTMGIAK